MGHGLLLLYSHIKNGGCKPQIVPNCLMYYPEQTVIPPSYLYYVVIVSIPLRTPRSGHEKVYPSNYYHLCSKVAFSPEPKSFVFIQKLLKTHKIVMLFHWVDYFFITTTIAGVVCSETTITAFSVPGGCRALLLLVLSCLFNSC